MKRLSYRDQQIQNYIEKTYGNTRKIRFDEVGKGYKACCYFYDELEQKEINGFPYSSDYLLKDGTSCSQERYATLSDGEKEGARLRFYYLPNSHELYIGGTGSGKTTGCVEPQLRAITKQKNKPNLFLTDPKGELFDRNAQHLVDQGYRLFVLNFKDIKRSDRWNPLIELYDEKIKLKNIGKGVVKKTGEVPKNMKKLAPPSEFGEEYLTYRGMAFPNRKAVDLYIQGEKDSVAARVDDLINQFTNMMIQVQSTKDPSWEYGAQDLLRGLMHMMLEDAVNPEMNFTADHMTFKTIRDIYLALKTPILSGDEELREHPMTQGRSENTLRLMCTALANAPNTMKSYCGVFDGAISDWFQGHILSMTTGNTIDLNVEDDKPFAIFVITRDYEKSDFKIAGLFIDWVYKIMLEKAENGLMTRPMHFMLDEFGNVPKIKDFENKIATSRSRNIWFHLVLQSYAQLDLVYSQDTAVIIRDNCNAQIFLGSQNIKTRETFSTECGRVYVPSVRAELDNEVNDIIDVPLVPPTVLDIIRPGEMYIKRIYTPVIMAQYIRSYIMTENGDFPYNTSDGLELYAPYNNEPFSSARYSYPPEKKPAEAEPIDSKKKYTWDV